MILMIHEKKQHFLKVSKGFSGTLKGIFHVISPKGYIRKADTAFALRIF